MSDVRDIHSHSVVATSVVSRSQRKRGDVRCPMSDVRCPSSAVRRPPSAVRDA